MNRFLDFLYYLGDRRKRPILVDIERRSDKHYKMTEANTMLKGSIERLNVAVENKCIEKIGNGHATK